MRTHQVLDQRSLELHRLIAAKLQQEPGLFVAVRENLAHWSATVSAGTQPYIAEWRNLADQGMAACLAVATQESEHAAALRQASPFAGILTHKERFAFFKAWSARRSHDPH